VLNRPKRSVSAPKQPKSALVSAVISEPKAGKRAPDSPNLESSVAKLDRFLQLIKA